LRIVLLALCAFVAAAIPIPVFADALDQGYNSMYNLDFSAAHKAFAEWEREHPDDPFGPASDAAAYLFFEFDRLKILRSEFLTDNRSFLSTQKLNADPAVKGAFESDLRRSDLLFQKMLKKGQPTDRALLSRVVCQALESDYLALIEKNNWQALKEIKQARGRAEVSNDWRGELSAEPEGGPAEIPASHHGIANGQGCWYTEPANRCAERALFQAVRQDSFGNCRGARSQQTTGQQSSG
jgi:hypothetical protein